MNERFNFYDVYGYFVPGFVLLGLLWLPFGLLNGAGPSLKFADAVAGVLAAYLVGHILSSLAARAVTFGRRVAPHETRVPSDDLLDRHCGLNPLSYIERVEKKIKREFGIDLAVTTAEKDLKLRRHAFLMCRDRLVLDGKGAYAEQFEGLYTMMRGISGGSVIAAYYLLGWLVEGILHEVRSPRGVLLDFPVASYVAVAFVLADVWLNHVGPSCSQDKEADRGRHRMDIRRCLEWVQHSWPKVAFAFCVATGCYFGAALAATHPFLSKHTGLMLTVVIATVFLASRSYAGYKYFAWTFAETVYRNFLAAPDTVSSASVP